MNAYLELIIRILLSIIVLIVLARIEGHKQISQMTYYDYIIGITVGSIAATLCIDQEIPILHGVIGIVIFMMSGVLFSLIARKSIKLKRLLKGLPIFLIAKGEILYKGLKRARFDISDLLRELRNHGYFDISEINYAILEQNGVVSILPKGYARPAKTEELKLNVGDDKLKANLIIDGKVLDGNLNAMDKTRKWLDGELQKQKVDNINDVILGCLDETGEFTLFLKNTSSKKHTLLE
ncbi:MAG: DUF421 domain-containing protein [Clostridia bacterium]